MSNMLPFPAFGSDEQARAPTLLNDDEDEAERRHIQKVLNAFQYYRKYAYTRLNKTEEYLNSLPVEDQKMLSMYRNHLECVRTCIDRNQTVIKEMMRQGELYPTEKNDRQPASNIRHQDMDHAQSTLKLIARDWSSGGAIEREQAYKPIIDTIEEFYKPDRNALNDVKILVPGAGLGRLLYELACRGYDCEGNEFSYFMLIASNFVLNQCDQENKYVLYPWVHQYVNTLRRVDQVAAVRFPDICPAKNPPKGNIMMAAGDFMEVYNIGDVYDCVATCFFIDCASNVIDFVRTIYKILLPGGIWVNLGPLLYHYSDMNGENSIEPTYEDLVIVMETIGFEIVSSKTGVRTKYAQNPQSMQKSEYECLFWVCRKPLAGKSSDPTTSSAATAATTAKTATATTMAAEATGGMMTSTEEDQTQTQQHDDAQQVAADNLDTLPTTAVHDSKDKDTNIATAQQQQQQHQQQPPQLTAGHNVVEALENKWL